MRRFCFVAGVVLVAFAGCGGRKEPDYFPLVAGARKSMRIITRSVENGDTSVTVEVKPVSVVIGERKLPGVGKVWVVETPHDSGPSSYAYFRRERDAIVQLLPRRGKPAAEFLFLSLPLAKGKSWFESDARRQRFEVVACETLATEAGVFPDCYKVAVLRADADWAMHQWFAPGVGPVKWEIRSVWEKDGVRHEQYRVAELVKYEQP